jgi:hypothetical protein
MAGGASGVQLYSNLVGLGAALATFAALSIGYVFLIKKQPICSEHLVWFFILNACIFVFLLTSVVYYQERSIVQD